MTRFGSLRRPGALISVAAAGVLGVGLAAGPASAHTPRWQLTCDNVSVNLQAYNGQYKNTVEVTVDGKDLVPVTTFGSSFQKQQLPLPDHGSEITARLIVKAGDDSKYDVDDTKTVKNCPVKSTPPTAPPSSQPPSSQPPSAPASSAPASSAPASPAPASSSAAAVPVASPSASGDNLAETGSSSSTPVIAGAAAVVVIAGAGILWASRKRRAAQH